MSGRRGARRAPAHVGKGELTELAISGARATARLDGEPVAFVLIDGRWFFETLSASEDPD